MERFEVRKVWDDGTSEIIHQGMSEAESHMLCYTYNRRVTADSKFYFEAVPQECSVSMALRLRR